MAVGELSGIDWPRTALPPQEQWPAGLAAVIATVLGAPVPMAIVVGEDQVLVYNDEYARILGSKHPAAFGRPAREALAENWTAEGHGDVVAQVYRTGESFYDPETVLPVQRSGPGGPREMVHFSRAYTAVRDDADRVVGVLAVIAETTAVTRALSGMATLTARLSTAVSVDHVVREALSYAVDDLQADHARVMVADGPAVRMARRAKIDGIDESGSRLPPLWVRMRPDVALPSAAVLDSGTALWLTAPDLAAYHDLDAEPLALQRLQRVATVPMRTSTVRGSLSLGWESAGGFGQTERATLTTVGNLVAQSIARAQRFDQQRDVADLLQLSMLPAGLPAIDGFGIAARYVPSERGTSAGGDFYDAFETTDGRYAVVIGDVVGHGVKAATIMGQVRAAARVLALREDDPASVLSGLDPFVASLGGEAFVTMLVGYLDPPSRTLRVACAGHPLPIVCRRVGERLIADPADVVVGTPVGVAAPRPTTDLALAADDILVLYTDGLIEVPGEDPEAGLRALLDVVTEAAATADPRRICSSLLEFRRVTSDDAALVVMTAQERRHRLDVVELPAEATSPGQARHWARATLTAWDADDDLVDGALLGVSELVTNSLLHAGTGARVELDLDEHRLLVLVTDGGTHASLVAQPAEPTSSRGRGLAVVEQISDAWGTEQTSQGMTAWFEIARNPAGE